MSENIPPANSPATETGEIIYQVKFLRKAPPPTAPACGPDSSQGWLSALRRWAIRRLLRSECPGYAEQADQFQSAETWLLVGLAIDEPEAPTQVLEEKIDAEKGVVRQKLLRQAAPPTPRPQSLWCRL